MLQWRPSLVALQRETTGGGCGLGFYLEGDALFTKIDMHITQISGGYA